MFGGKFTEQQISSVEPSAELMEKITIEYHRIFDSWLQYRKDIAEWDRAVEDYKKRNPVPDISQAREEILKDEGITLKRWGDIMYYYEGGYDDC